MELLSFVYVAIVHMPVHIVRSTVEAINAHGYGGALSGQSAERIGESEYKRGGVAMVAVCEQVAALSWLEFCKLWQDYMKARVWLLCYCCTSSSCCCCCRNFDVICVLVADTTGAVFALPIVPDIYMQMIQYFVQNLGESIVPSLLAGLAGGVGRGARLCFQI